MHKLLFGKQFARFFARTKVNLNFYDGWGKKDVNFEIVNFFIWAFLLKILILIYSHGNFFKVKIIRFFKKLKMYDVKNYFFHFYLPKKYGKK